MTHGTFDRKAVASTIFSHTNPTVEFDSHAVLGELLSLGSPLTSILP